MAVERIECQCNSFAHREISPPFYQTKRLTNIRYTELAHHAFESCRQARHSSFTSKQHERRHLDYLVHVRVPAMDARHVQPSGPEYTCPGGKYIFIRNHDLYIVWHRLY